MSAGAWLLTLSLGLAGLGLAHAADKDKETVTYRWVDDKGVVHFGDRIPAQESQKERSIINREGVEVGKLDAQRSPAQIAEQARRDQEQLRLQQHDTFLMTTYTSAKDIEELRDARLDQLNGQHLAAEQYVQNLNTRLSALQAQAMTYKPYSDKPGARKMPDDLAENLVRALSELRTQRNTLDTKDREEQAVRTEFDGDIRRYKELRAAMAAHQ
jgi:glutamine synthetase type III